MESKKGYVPRVETKLNSRDFDRVDELAKLENKTKSEVVREAVLWYLDHKDNLRNQERDIATARAIDGMTNRVCAMLARQGGMMATLFELTYDGMSQTKEGVETFKAAVVKARQKMANKVDSDERELVEKMKKVVKGVAEKASEADAASQQVESAKS